MKLRLQLHLPINLNAAGRTAELNQASHLFGDQYPNMHATYGGSSANNLIWRLEVVFDGSLPMTQERWAYMTARQYTLFAEPPCAMCEPVTDKVTAVKEEQG